MRSIAILHVCYLYYLLLSALQGGLLHPLLAVIGRRLGDTATLCNTAILLQYLCHVFLYNVAGKLIYFLSAPFCLQMLWRYLLTTFAADSSDALR